jgi:hypothetical protein
MSANWSITANFRLTTYNLTTSSSSGGTVTTPGTGNFTYNCSQVVNIIATPSPCYIFVNWTGNTGNVTNTSAASTTITMNANASIQANFIYNCYNLTTSTGVGGTVTIPGIGTYTYNTSQIVNIIATPNLCYAFLNWTGTGVVAGKVADPNASSTTINMSNDYTVQANFRLITYTLTVSNSSGGTVSAPGIGTFTYNCNQIVNIVAVPNPCYSFVNWSGNTTAIVNTSATSTTINMSDNWSITANFVANSSSTLTYIAGVHGSIVGNVSQTIICGGDGTAVTAVASAGYHFLKWNDSSTDNPRTDTNVLANISVMAIFVMPGNGTAGDPYIIMNITDFQEVELNLSAYYAVGCNIDASATTLWNGGDGFIPISTFSGGLDGQDYTITGLYLNDPTNIAGLAPFYTNLGTIENLNFANVFVVASNLAGGFCVENDGTITNCSTTGIVYATNIVSAGFACYNIGTISECYSTCTVLGGSYVGGFVGFNYYGLVTDCYATGKVVGIDSVAGFCSVNDGGTLTNCYSVGHVTGSSTLAGFCSQNYGTVNDCFWDTDTSFQPASDGGTGKTTIEMMQEATFTNWDFITPIWYIIEGWTYPTLESMVCVPVVPTNISVIVSDTGTNDNKSIYLSWDTGIGDTGTFVAVCEDMPCNCSDVLALPAQCSILYNGINTSVVFNNADLTAHDYYFMLWGYTTCYGNTSYSVACDQEVVNRRVEVMFMAYIALALGLMVIAFWQRKTWIFLLSGMSWIGFGAYGLMNGSTGDLIWYFGWLGIAAGLVMFTAPTWLREKDEPTAYDDEADEYKASLDKMYKKEPKED